MLTFEKPEDLPILIAVAFISFLLLITVISFNYKQGETSEDN